MTGLDLGNIQRLFDRAGDGDPDVITGGGPWQPRNLPAKAKKADIIWNRRNRELDLARLAELVEDGPRQQARTAEVLADVHATIARYGRGRHLKAVA